MWVLKRIYLIYFFIICFNLKTMNPTIKIVNAIFISVGNEAVAVEPRDPKFDPSFVRLKMPSERILED